MLTEWRWKGEREKEEEEKEGRRSGGRGARWEHVGLVVQILCFNRDYDGGGRNFLLISTL